MALWPPPLLRTRRPAVRVAQVVLGPVLFGVLCGWLLGVSGAAYLVLTTLGILGGVTNGYEHLGARAGARRGVAGGFLFAGTILLTNELIGATPDTRLPDPRILLLALFAFVGTLLGALGGALRARRADA